MSDVTEYSRSATQHLSMSFSNSITLTSETAVGSSTSIDALRAHFGPLRWRYVSAGSIMRMFAERLGMTIDQFAAHNKAHPEEGWDAECDRAVAVFGRQNFTVIEGRLPHVFVPRAFHVKLVCDPEIRAARRAKDRAGQSVESVIAEIIARDRNDNERYEKIYPGCLWPLEDFDLVVDTGASFPKEVVTKIAAAHSEWREAHANITESLML